jgi:pimeloyl-ACP methyl ester carboxylesterase
LTLGALSASILSVAPARTSSSFSLPTIEPDLLRIPAGPGAVHVARYGHGATPIVLLHGFGTSSFLWRNVAAELALAKFTAYAVDLLGYGESDRPYGADYGIAAQAEYVDRAMTGLRIRNATVVGLDAGAGVALRLAATSKHRVQRLVLINPVAFDEVPGKEIRKLQRSVVRFPFGLSRSVMGAAQLLLPILEGAVARPEHMPPRLQARYLAPYTGRDGVHHLLLLARALHKRDLEELDLRAMHAPTLVVWGDLDPWLEPRLADRLINAIPDSRLVRLPRASRLVPEDDPGALTDLIMRFAAGKDTY